MKHPIVVAFVLALLARTAVAVVPGGWSTNFAAAVEDAGKRQQPVLVYFTASWCGPCQLMARTTLTNDAVLQQLDGLIHVALDLDEETKLAAHYEIRAVPTFLMLDSAGEQAATTTGFQDAENLLAWLTNGVTEANAAMARQKEAAQKLVEIDQWLAGGDSNSLQKAAAGLLELCANRNEGTRQPANDRLAALARREPSLVLDGMAHPRLAARIATSNLLRKQFGDGFEIDPWSDSASRAKSIAVWREKLTVEKAGR
jgi:thioredoxin 1